MRFGIDFGTTRTVVARADRGNYPVLTLCDTEGVWREFFPSVAALEGEELRFGYEALRAAQGGAVLARSFKRVLGEPATTVTTTVEVGGREFLLLDVLTGFLTALRRAIHESLGESGLAPASEADEVVISVPAHAHTAQRFLTIEAFRRAGFNVVALVNEPSAAGFEYTHRQPRTFSSRRTQVLVYDLGGGTFDASLVKADGGAHEVISSVGVNRLGGDDFDVVLAQTALQSAGIASDTLTAPQWRHLVEDSREAKERLTPQTRRIMLEIEGEPVVVAVDDFYEAAQPLVERSIEEMEPLVGALDKESASQSLAEVAGIYLVGGGSGLPMVPRQLRERFGRRVHRSPYPAAATSIGLAIAADPESPFTLIDRLSRGFGVFRERSGGAALGFDQIFSRDDTLPQEGVFTATRRYRPAHNIGWFRYVEYTAQDAAGDPRGEIVPFAEALFPFDPALRGVEDLSSVPVQRVETGPLVQETYTVNAAGIVEVSIEDVETGFSRRYGLR